MASTNTDFVVKNGLIVNTNLIWASSGKVGINNSSPDANLTVTGTANISGNVVLSSNTTIKGRLDVNNTAYIDTRLYVGNTDTTVTLTNPLVQAVDNFNGFVQISSQNLSKEDDACSDLLIYADNTDGFTYFNDVGLNNSRFDGRIHRISANTLADNLILGETVFQSNGSANIAVGILLNTTTINATSRSLTIAVANGGSFVNTAGNALSLRGESSTVNSNIIVAVPYGATSIYSRRNYPFTVGIRTDGYLYQANGALTVGTTEGGVRSTYQQSLAAGVTFSGGSNTVTVLDTSLLYPELIIEGAGLPANTRIASVINSTAFKINKQTLSSNSGVYTFTDPAYDAAGNPIVFHTNGMLAENEIARFSGNGNLTLGSNTVSRNSRLTVDGRANITGNVAVGGNLTVIGVTNLQSTFTASNTASLIGAVTLSNTILVTGAATFSNSVIVPATGINVGTATINSTTYSGTAANASLLNKQPASFYTNATNLTTGTLSNARLPAVATTITQVGTLSALTVSGNTTLSASVSLTTNATANVVTISAANVNIDSGVLFVDSVNNRVGVNTTSPDAVFTISGTANVSGNTTIGGSLTVNGNFVTTGTSVANGDLIPTSNSYDLGNTTQRWDLFALSVDTSNVVTIGITQTNVVVNTIAITFSNSTVTSSINALSYTGTAANATLFNNQPPSFYANATNITSGTVAPARLPQANATTNGAVLILDSVVNTAVSIYAAAPNSVKTAYDAALSANTRAASAQSAATQAYSNAVTYINLQATEAYTNAITYSGNAAAAYANAIAFSGNAALAYANAVTFASNATNLTTGTIPYARIPVNVVNTTAAFTRTGVTTFSANVILGSSGLSANGGFGLAGEVLHSNGTATYWAADDQGVTSVSAGNGLSGGIITQTGTLSVVAGTGIISNTIGVHVNPSYIGTLTANNAGHLGTVPASTFVRLDASDIGQTPSFRVIRNTTALSDGMYIGYGSTNGGTTRIYSGGSTTGHYYSDASGNIFRSDGTAFVRNDGGTYNIVANTANFLGIYAASNYYRTGGTNVALNDGGTNSTLTAVSGAIAFSNATGIAFSSVGTSGQVLTSQGSGAPTWTSQASLSVGSATNATNLNNIAGTSYYRSGGTDVAVADGGTGASDAGTARSNLGIGSMATRNVTITTSGSPSGGASGDIWYQYVA